MKLNRFYVQNFRRLEDVEISLSEKETIFVGPNNSGKTSAAMVFRLFVNQNREFKIFDFSAALLESFNEFGKSEGNSDKQIPSIDLDLWFTVDPETEYGRIASFLPSLSAEYPEVGVRISYSVDNPAELHKAYRDSATKKTLSQFLEDEGHLKKHFSLKYFKLESMSTPFSKDKVQAHPIEKDEGRKTLGALIWVDFVDAQRNIDDSEAARSTRLSSVLADYYATNLEKPENDSAAIKVIDESNKSLSTHYENQFKSLIETIGDLGFPSANDRGLKVLSTLKPESVLRGDTTLLYIDKDSDHQLPEAYNGLGFKNLIYIAIQISHFQRKWISIQKSKPLCHIIFIEEPEVHLHAQVQQVFIRQIRQITEKTAADLKVNSSVPQMLISTHSSHIIEEGDFTSIRYFQRSKSQLVKKSKRKIATKVLSLKNFEPEKKDPENLKFLKRYMKLTHCNLFFSDAAILVEGSVEKLLLPRFIESNCKRLQSTYLTVLELGGAYAHRLVPMIDFIGLPTLIITDLDSVDPDKNLATCKADQANATTSNKTISALLGKSKIKELLELNQDDKICCNEKSNRRIAFQLPVPVPSYGEDKKMIPRTFEESFIYHNIEIAREGKIDVFVKLSTPRDYQTDYNCVFDAVKSKNYKKVEFALNLIDTDQPWITPSYITEGLTWLGNSVSQESIGMSKVQDQK